MSDTQDNSSNPIINQVVVVLTPLFALAAAVVAGWAGRHIPGLQLDATQITALMVAISTAAVTMAVKWLHGWQKHEEALRQQRLDVNLRPSVVTPSNPDKPVAVVAEA